MKKKDIDTLIESGAKVVSFELDNKEFSDLLTELTSEGFTKENKHLMKSFYYRGVQIVSKRMDNDVIDIFNRDNRKMRVL